VRTTVLIVDDHDDFRASVTALLEAEGFAVLGEAAEGAHLQARLQDGSDGTRTRDLRRDRPNRIQARSAANVAERNHLQALFIRASVSSAWLSQFSSRRLGHERATKCCQPRRQIVLPRRASAHRYRCTNN
jgi:CheY-like chemotaxis protein